jgi:hypothetical protein
VLGFLHQTIIEARTLEAMRTQALSLVSVRLQQRF